MVAGLPSVMEPLRFRLNPNYDSSARSSVRGELLGKGFVRRVVRVAPGTEEIDASDVLVGGFTGETPGWMPSARAEFLGFLDQLGSMGERWIWPMAGEAIADAPSVLSFLRSRNNWRFVLCVADLLVPSLESRMDDHVRRLLEALAGHPQLGLVLVSSYTRLGESGGPAPWGTNAQFDSLIERWLVEHLRKDVQYCVLEGDAFAVAAVERIAAQVEAARTSSGG